jgi:hypothetical protein
MHRNVERILDAHPEPPLVAREVLADAITTVLTAAQTCAACADACLAEQTAEQLVHCIRLCQDASDICAAAGRILSRQTAPDLGLVTMTVELCAAACQACALEANRHASYHAECQVCTATCQRARDACRTLLVAAAKAARMHH